jgi:hypothetical protein
MLAQLPSLSVDIDKDIQMPSYTIMNVLTLLKPILIGTINLQYYLLMSTGQKFCDNLDSAFKQGDWLESICTSWIIYLWNERGVRGVDALKIVVS